MFGPSNFAGSPGALLFPRRCYEAVRTPNGTAWSAVTMVCYADLIRAGKELGCVAESARKTDTVEIEKL